MVKKFNVQSANKKNPIKDFDQEKNKKKYDDLSKSNFDNAKMISDFAGMIIRLGFVFAAMGYFFPQMQLRPGLYGTILTVTTALIFVLVVTMLFRIYHIVYYALIKCFSSNYKNTNLFIRISVGGLAFLTLIGIVIIGVMIALDTRTFQATSGP